jgi:hypothetical protein
VILSLDTSGLLKRYLDEPGRDLVLREMRGANEWVASAVAFTEAHLAICRGVAARDRERLLDALAHDEERFLVVPVDELCLARAAEIGCAYELGALDAIHLGAIDRMPRPIHFLTFDRPQAAVAAKLGYQVIGPWVTS